MKKVLILAYDFPPYNSIGGQRPYSWYKYFKELELYPIVVTRHWDLKIENPVDYIKPSINRKVEIENTIYGTIIKTPFSPNLRDKMILKFGLYRYSFFRRILTFFYQLFEFVFPLFDNKNNIYLGANDYLKDNQVDCIIATGEPFILFKYASKLSSKFNIPWIADYRDGWSQNYNRGKFEQVFYKYFEKRLVKTTNFITTVSCEFVKQINFLHVNKKCDKVLNGYFEERFEKIENHKNNLFTIVFSGTLYSYQPIEIFANALKNVLLKYQEFNFRILFIGIEFQPTQLKRVRQAFDFCVENLETTPRLAHHIAINNIQKADLFLLPASSKFPQIYAKVFDYIKIGKPIMLFESDNGSLRDIILETNSGVICDSEKEIEDYLIKFYREWEKTGTVECNSSNVEKYSRKEQARKLCELIQTRII